MVKEIRGRSGAGSVPVHGLAPQNLSPDKHVDGCVDSDEDRGSTPLASTKRLRLAKKQNKPSQLDLSHAINIIILITIALSFRFYESSPPDQDRLPLRTPPCLTHPLSPTAATSSSHSTRKRPRRAKWLRYFRL